MIRTAWVWIARTIFIVFAVVLLAATLSEAWSSMKFTVFRQADKVAHFWSMYIFTSVSLLAFPEVRSGCLFLGAIAIAALIEAAQLFGPRTADVLDLAASIAGIVAVALVYFSPKLRSKAKREEN